MLDILNFVTVFLYIHTKKQRGVIFMTLYLSLEIRALVIIMSTARSSLAEPLSGAKFNTIIHPQQFDGDFLFFILFLRL